MKLKKDQCSFCQKKTHYNKDLNIYTCQTCCTSHRIQKKKRIIWLGCYLKDRRYTVYLNEIDNKTHINSWHITDDDIDIGTLINVFDEVLSITPLNIEEKLKTILVFS